MKDWLLDLSENYYVDMVNGEIEIIPINEGDSD